MKKNRIILARWPDGSITLYSSVVRFLAAHPGRSYDTIMSYLSRKKEPYFDEGVRLDRLDVNIFLFRDPFSH